MTIRRSGPTNAAASVEFSTQNGTAVSGENYIAQKATVTIPPGKTEQTVQVQVRDDIRVAGDKTAILILSNPAGAELGDYVQAELIIQDDDSSRTTLLTFGMDRIPLLNRVAYSTYPFTNISPR